LSPVFDFFNWVISGIHWVVNVLGGVFNAAVSLVSGAVFIVIIVLTKPDKEISLVEDYYDAALGKFVQRFDVKLKFAGNPLFQRIKVFEYVGQLTYEISAMEFGSHEKLLVEGAFQDTPKKGHNEITITEKSMLSKRKVPLLRIVTAREATANYVLGITSNVQANQIDLANVNPSPIKHYPVPCTRLSAAQKRVLLSSQKVEDVYKSGQNWVVVVKEIPAAMLGHPGTDTIRY
jgi:hypothetical protein